MSQPTSLGNNIRRGLDNTAILSELINRLWPSFHSVDNKLHDSLADMRQLLNRLYRAYPHSPLTFQGHRTLVHAVESIVKASNELNVSLESSAHFLQGEGDYNPSRAKQTLTYLLFVRIQQAGRKKKLLQAGEELAICMRGLAADLDEILSGYY